MLRRWAMSRGWNGSRMRWWSGCIARGLRMRKRGYGTREKRRCDCARRIEGSGYRWRRQCGKRLQGCKWRVNLWSRPTKNCFWVQSMASESAGSRGIAKKDNREQGGGWSVEFFKQGEVLREDMVCDRLHSS